MPIADSGSQPNAIICLSLSETIIFFAIVGARFDPDNEDKATALVETPLVLSQ